MNKNINPDNKNLSSSFLPNDWSMIIPSKKNEPVEINLRSQINLKINKNKVDSNIKVELGGKFNWMSLYKLLSVFLKLNHG